MFPISDRCQELYNEWMAKQWYLKQSPQPAYFVMSHNDLQQLRREFHQSLHVAHSENKASFYGIEIAIRTSTRDGVELF